MESSFIINKNTILRENTRILFFCRELFVLVTPCGWQDCHVRQIGKRKATHGCHFCVVFDSELCSQDSLDRRIANNFHKSRNKMSVFIMKSGLTVLHPFLWDIQDSIAVIKVLVHPLLASGCNSESHGTDQAWCLQPPLRHDEMVAALSDVCWRNEVFLHRDW